MGSYILINGVTWFLRKVTGGRMVPPSYVNAEPLIIPPTGIIPIWMFVLVLFHLFFLFSVLTEHVSS